LGALPDWRCTEPVHREGRRPFPTWVVPYSIQTLKRLKPAWFRQDLIALLDLLQQQEIKPLIAQRLPLAEARQAQELLGKGGVTGKIVLVRDDSSLQSGAA
jgi:NADPH:quinone reductase-like Zn-dependent oxidoreductase